MTEFLHCLRRVGSVHLSESVIDDLDWACQYYWAERRYRVINRFLSVVESLMKYSLPEHRRGFECKSVILDITMYENPDDSIPKTLRPYYTLARKNYHRLRVKVEKRRQKIRFLQPLIGVERGLKPPK